RVIVVSGGQLQFPATQKPSTDPNTFDDSREGTWVPTITATGGASGQVYSDAKGFSLKWGRYVVLTFNVTLSTMGTFSGNIGIGNLPIPTDQGVYYTQVGTIEWHTLATPVVRISAMIDPGSPQFLRLYGTAGAS